MRTFRRTRLAQMTGLAVALVLGAPRPAGAVLRVVAFRDVTVARPTPVGTGYADVSPSMVQTATNGTWLVWLRTPTTVSTTPQPGYVLVARVPGAGALDFATPTLAVAASPPLTLVAASHDATQPLVLIAGPPSAEVAPNVRLWQPTGDAGAPSAVLRTEGAPVDLAVPHRVSPLRFDLGLALVGATTQPNVVAATLATGPDYSNPLGARRSVAGGTAVRVVRALASDDELFAVAVAGTVALSDRTGGQNSSVRSVTGSPPGVAAVRSGGFFVAVADAVARFGFYIRDAGSGGVSPASPALLATGGPGLGEIAAATDVGQARGAWVAALLPTVRGVLVYAHGSPDAPLVVQEPLLPYDHCGHLTAAPLASDPDVAFVAASCTLTASAVAHVVLLVVRREPDAMVPDASVALDGAALDAAVPPDVLTALDAAVPDALGSDAIAAGDASNAADAVAGRAVSRRGLRVRRGRRRPAPAVPLRRRGPRRGTRSRGRRAQPRVSRADAAPARVAAPPALVSPSPCAIAARCPGYAPTRSRARAASGPPRGTTARCP